MVTPNHLDVTEVVKTEGGFLATKSVKTVSITNNHQTESVSVRYCHHNVMSHYSYGSIPQQIIWLTPGFSVDIIMDHDGSIEIFGSGMPVKLITHST